MSCQVFHPEAHRKQFSDTEPNIRQSFWNSLEDGEEKFKKPERPKTLYVNLQSQLTSAYGDIERPSTRVHACASPRMSTYMKQVCSLAFMWGP